MIGSILLIALSLLGRNKFHLRGHGRDALLITLSGVAMGTSWMFLYEAYQQIGVSFASLLYYCGPVIVMILLPLLFHERLTRPKIAGFAIVLMAYCSSTAGWRARATAGGCSAGRCRRSCMPSW